jgi:hypothetical protein
MWDRSNTGRDGVMELGSIGIGEGGLEYTPAPRVVADGSRIYGRRMVRNASGRYFLARLERMPNGYWRADFIGSGLVETFETEPSHVAA